MYSNSDSIDNSDSHYECYRYRLKKNLSWAKDSPPQFFYRDEAINVKNARKERIQHKAPTRVILEETVDHPVFITEAILNIFKVFLKTEIIFQFIEIKFPR